MSLCVFVCLCACVSACVHVCLCVGVAMQSVLRYIAPTTWPVTSLVWDSVRASPHCGPGLPVGARVVPQCCCDTGEFVCVCVFVCVFVFVCACVLVCWCCYAVSAEVYHTHNVAVNQPSLGLSARIALLRAWPGSRSKGSTSVLLQYR